MGTRSNLLITGGWAHDFEHTAPELAAIIDGTDAASVNTVVVDDLDEAVGAIRELDRVRVDPAHDQPVPAVAEVVEFCAVGGLGVEPRHLAGGERRGVVVVTEEAHEVREHAGDTEGQDHGECGEGR